VKQKILRAMAIARISEKLHQHTYIGQLNMYFVDTFTDSAT
jgi:hypothetical protein